MHSPVETKEDWELSFYSLTKVTDAEFLIQPHQPADHTKPRIDPVHLQKVVGASTSRLDHPIGPRSDAPMIEGKSPSALHKKVQLSPLKPANVPSPWMDDDPSKSPNNLHSKESLKLDPTTKPGWLNLDSNRNMFDYLSPSRLLGPRPDPAKHIDTHNLRNPVLIYRKKVERKADTSPEEIIPPRNPSPPKRIPHSVSIPQMVPRPKLDFVPKPLPKMESFLLPKKPLSDKPITSAPNKRSASEPKTTHFDPSTPQAPQTSQSPQTPQVDAVQFTPDILTDKLMLLKRRQSRKVLPTKTTVDTIKEKEEAVTRLLAEEFKKYDLNGDGTISRKEAYLLLSNSVLTHTDKTEDEVKKVLNYIMAKMDHDEDHRITFDEYNRCAIQDPLLQGCFGTTSLIKKI